MQFLARKFTYLLMQFLARKFTYLFTYLPTYSHKKAIPEIIKEGYNVMVRLPDRKSKLSTKFTGQRYVLSHRHGNRCEVYDPFLKKSEIVQSDRLKVRQATAHTSYDDRTTTDIADGNKNTNNISAHSYKLRSQD